MEKSRFFIRYGGKIILREQFKLLLLAIPFVLFIFAFSYVPLFGWVYSFFDYKPGTSLFDTRFAGLKYFIRTFKEWSELTRVLRNTLAMSFLGLLSSPFPVVFAIMLNEIKGRRFKKLVQTTTTLPNFISWVIIYSIMFALFSADGLWNAVKAKLGLDPAQINILGNVDLVWLFQWGIGLWKGLGWSAIVYLAAIAGSANIAKIIMAKDDAAFDKARQQMLKDMNTKGLESVLQEQAKLIEQAQQEAKK